MRVDWGPFAADALFTAAGYGVLNATGFLRNSLRDAVTAVGLAFLAGVSFVSLVSIALLTAGVPLRLPTFVALTAGTTLLGLLLRRDWLGPVRRPRRLTSLRSGLRRPTAQTAIAVLTLSAFAAYAVVGALMARVQPLNVWDAWSIWTRKAEVLFYSGSLPKEFFASSAYTFMHPDYPLLLPVFESIQFRAMGTIDTQAIHLQFWLLLIAFVAAILHLGIRRGTLREWLPLAIAVSVAPSVYGQLLTAYADIPMALFLAIGVLLLAEWLVGRESSALALAALFLAASANTKNEGLLAAVAALIVAAATIALSRRYSDLRSLAIGAAGFVIAVLPWRIWIAAHGIHGDLPLLKGLRPSYLADRADRIWPSVHSLYGQLLAEAGWLYLIPFGAGLALVSVFIGRRRSMAGFFLATGLIGFAALVWADSISDYEPLDYFLSITSYRVVAAVAAVAFAALLHLAAPARDAERP